MTSSHFAAGVVSTAGRYASCGREVGGQRVSVEWGGRLMATVPFG